MEGSNNFLPFLIFIHLTFFRFFHFWKREKKNLKLGSSFYYKIYKQTIKSINTVMKSKCTIFIKRMIGWRCTDIDEINQHVGGVISNRTTIICTGTLNIKQGFRDFWGNAVMLSRDRQPPAGSSGRGWQSRRAETSWQWICPCWPAYPSSDLR